MDAVQAHVVVLELVQLQDTHGYHVRFLAVYAEYAVAHHVCAGVYSYYYSLRHSVSSALSPGLFHPITSMNVVKNIMCVPPACVKVVAKQCGSLVVPAGGVVLIIGGRKLYGNTFRVGFYTVASTRATFVGVPNIPEKLVPTGGRLRGPIL